MGDTITEQPPENIAGVHQNTMQSVVLIDRILAQSGKTQSDVDALRRNSDHLVIMSAKSWWGTHDTSQFLRAAQSARAYLARGEQTVSPPAPVITSVTMRQARLALLQAGRYDAVQAAMATQSTAAQIEWEYALTVERDSPLTSAMAGILGLDATQLDTLFAQAATL